MEVKPNLQSTVNNTTYAFIHYHLGNSSIGGGNPFRYAWHSKTAALSKAILKIQEATLLHNCNLSHIKGSAHKNNSGGAG